MDHLTPLLKSLSDPSLQRKKVISGTFTPDEMKVIDAIIDYRIANGLTALRGEFIRQCVLFAIKSDPGIRFAQPSNAYISEFLNPKTEPNE